MEHDLKIEHLILLEHWELISEIFSDLLKGLRMRICPSDI